MMKKLLKNVDFYAGLGAFAFAIAAVLVPDLDADGIGELAELVDPKVAAGFGILALGRALKACRAKG